MQSESPARGGAPRVLIVDDSADVTVVVTRLLEIKGYAARAAGSARAALEACGRFQPEAAVLDIRLPDMDGYALATRLRALPGLAEIVLIAVSGEPADAERLARAGFAHHFEKPVSVDDLLGVLPATRPERRQPAG